MSDTVDESKGVAKPPYISFKTLLNLWDRLATDGFPARIDKSFLESTAGGYATVVIASLRWLGYLHEDGRPTDSLKEIVTAPEGRRRTLLGDALRDRYPGLETAAEANQTQSQFLEYFTDTWGLAGDTRRKAVAFYLGAAKWAGVSTGPLWKTPASGSGSRRSSNGRSTKAEPPAPEPPAPEPPAAPQQVSDPLVEGLSTALRGVLERLPKFGETWTSRERDMFKRSFDNVLEWDYPVSDGTSDGPSHEQ